jgi:hypothetical protein
MMAFLRRTLPTAVALIVGLAVLAGMFTPYPWLDAIGTYLLDTAVIVAAFALFLGLLNVLRVHTDRIRQGQPGRFFSVVLIGSMLFVLVVGLPSIPNQPSGPSQPILQWIFQNVQVPIQASLSALLVFFVVTAAYRLLRLRSPESAMMLIVALIVLGGQLFAGLVPILSDLKDWILAVPTVAGVRGILLGAALGILLTSIRLLAGVERPYGD